MIAGEELRVNLTLKAAALTRGMCELNLPKKEKKGKGPHTRIRARTTPFFGCVPENLTSEWRLVAQTKLSRSLSCERMMLYREDAVE